jgi:hypothetical protein
MLSNLLIGCGGQQYLENLQISSCWLSEEIHDDAAPHVLNTPARTVNCTAARTTTCITYAPYMLLALPLFIISIYATSTSEACVLIMM